MDKVLVFYDGQCALCQGWVLFILERDKKDRFQFAGLDSSYALANGIEKSDSSDEETVVVSYQGRKLTHSEAALMVLQELGGCWRIFGLLKVIPKGIRDRIYQFIARNRYRWFGRKSLCIIPPKKWEHKFLN